MALDTYTNLQAAIAGLLNRTDLASAIPDFITLAESQMVRRFVARWRSGQPLPRRMFKRATSPLVTSQEYTALPTDIMGPVDFFLQTTPITKLEFLETPNLQSKKEENDTSVGIVPKWYTIIGGEAQFYPVVDQAYTSEMTYIARPSALSGTVATNWVLSEFPDAYLYGAATQSAPYLKNDSRLEVWGTLFTTAIDDICNADPMPTEKSVLRTDIPLFGYWPTDLTTV